MINPEDDPTKTVAYDFGFRWASQHGGQLRELYSSNNLSAPEFRTRLWKIAESHYPSRRGDMENDVKQTLFVMGAIRRFIDTIPVDRESLQEIFEIGTELGAVWSSEVWKMAHLEALRRKDASWWRKKKGDASPNQLINALSSEWAHRHPKAKRTTKWEILIDQFGTREMCALATLENISYNGDGSYKTYDVEGDDCSFQMMADNVGEWRDGRYIIHQHAGEIVG